MTIIKIESYGNGGHEDQSINGVSPETFPIPEGYALLPESLGTPETLENFPFGNITVEKTNGVPTVTSWVPGTPPEPVEPPKEYISAPLADQIKAVSDRQDFLEDCIAEMATKVYG